MIEFFNSPAFWSGLVLAILNQVVGMYNGYQWGLREGKKRFDK